MSVLSFDRCVGNGLIDPSVYCQHTVKSALLETTCNCDADKRVCQFMAQHELAEVNMAKEQVPAIADHLLEIAKHTRKDTALSCNI